MLRSYFGFDNLTGKKWFKLPGYDEIVNGKYLNFNKTNSSIIQPINNSFFDKELLSKNLNSTFDLIKSENKISFISDVLHNNSDILILVFENQPDYLVCRVVDSYEASLISKNMLYKFEGFDDSFEFDIYGLYQTQIEFISTLDQSGKMIYKDKFFTDYENVKNITDKKIVGEKIIKQDMKQDEIIEILKDLQKRVEKIENKKVFKNPFKKSLETLLTEKKLLGEITMVDSSNYQVKKDDEYLLIKFKKGLFTNSIELILKSKNPIV
jgi:hypothetical protein